MRHRQISLTQGKVALIDSDLFDKLVILGPWRFAPRKGRVGYGASHKAGYLHQAVFRLTTGCCPKQIDHIDRNGLNNQRKNLRAATYQQNAANAEPHRDNKSGYKGVHQLPYGRWRAVIWDGTRANYLGIFDTPEEAAEAYNNAALELFGDFAWLNPLPKKQRR